VIRYVLLVLNEFVADGLLGVRGLGTELKHTVNDDGDEMKTVQVVHHRRLTRRFRFNAEAQRNAENATHSSIKRRLATTTRSTTLSGIQYDKGRHSESQWRHQPLDRKAIPLRGGWRE